jgi:L-fuculose-phosphate aldolase
VFCDESAETYLPEFQAAGLALSNSGLIIGASGNLSLRLKDRLVITRHGSVLSALTSPDLVETDIYMDDSSTPLASWELPVHRFIYAGTAASTIVHTHPPCAVTLSLVEKKSVFPGKVSVLGANTDIVAGVLAVEIARELKKRPLVMVKGHGSFAIGRTFAEACELTIEFETECSRLYRQRSIPVLKSRE